jgi:FKBP-type peptidyl-prolyl cis-trans isomerase
MKQSPFLEMAKEQAMQKEQEGMATLQSETNAIEGAEFLALNGAKEGVTTTASGLQYRVLTAGTGPTPTAESTVEVHYAGRLLDGTEFDSSIKRGVPTQFGVTQVIAGWTEGLQLMTEGSKWEFYIPADLAYGPGGTGPIGPNATLIFEVELLQANVADEN